jgi:hypothetical protein
MGSATADALDPFGLSEASAQLSRDVLSFLDE